MAFCKVSGRENSHITTAASSDDALGKETQTKSQEQEERIVDVLKDIRKQVFDANVQSQQMYQLLFDKLSSNQVDTQQLLKQVVEGMLDIRKTLSLVLEETKGNRATKCEGEQQTTSRLILLNNCYEPGIEVGIPFFNDNLSSRTTIKTEPATSINGHCHTNSQCGEKFFQVPLANFGSNYNFVASPLRGSVISPENVMSMSPHQHAQGDNVSQLGGETGTGRSQPIIRISNGNGSLKNGMLQQQNIREHWATSNEHLSLQRVFGNDSNFSGFGNETITIKTERGTETEEGKKNKFLRNPVITSMNKPTTCQYCQREFFYNHSLVLHSRSCKRRYETLAQQMATKGDAGDLKNSGTNDAMASAGTSTTPSVKLNAKMIHCNYCNRRFPTQHQVTSHERVHTGEKPYDCSVCKTVFAHAGNMIKHMKSKHPDCNAYRCRLCKVSFKTHGEVLAHRKDCKMQTAANKSVKKDEIIM